MTEGFVEEIIHKRCPKVSVQEINSGLSLKVFGIASELHCVVSAARYVTTSSASSLRLRSLTHLPITLRKYRSFLEFVRELVRSHTYSLRKIPTLVVNFLGDPAGRNVELFWGVVEGVK
jgi:hypothetical protein